MQAAVVNVLGQAPRYETFVEPRLRDGESLIHVRAAGLHPIVKALASGSHYAGNVEVPMVPGVDGVGRLEDGRRVYFTFARKPWGAMCERTVCPRGKCLPVPEGVSDVLAAALPNPGMSAWLSLKERALLARDETVLILGATGVAGQLAAQVARFLGALRVIGAGRNVEAIDSLGLDAVVALGQPDEAVKAAFAPEVEKGIDVVIDYLWGRPSELLMETLGRQFRPGRVQTTRWVELGESAGKTITLPGSLLRSIDLRLRGGGFGSVSLEGILAAIPQLFSMAESGALTIDAVPVPLTEVESAWGRVEKGRRIVFTL
jgi:NADPH:quinone reductase-like Zn-dependent oxidoreductase